MGRPLYSSILLSRQATKLPATQPQPPKTNPMLPKTESPEVTKWSRTNAFDPDSDEFFNEDNAVYEVFLSEEQVATRAMEEQTQRMRSLTERLLRERINDARSTTPHDGRLRLNVDAEANRRRPSDLDAYFVDGLVREISRSGISQTEPPSTQEDAPPSNVAFPSATARDNVAASSRTHPVDLVSGLRYLSESPRPLDPVDLPPRSISPIPNTPARISDVFPASPSPRRRTSNVAPRSGPSLTSQSMSWESPSRLELVMPGVGHNVEARLPSVPRLSHHE
ncbi:hypothetical protein BU17DRAFT_100149 [Hysterangium stoloniferum]|nr:hypothetical protein BU17DRAFT_100149 [Hysterangium stoloniferum]